MLLVTSKEARVKCTANFMSAFIFIVGRTQIVEFEVTFPHESMHVIGAPGLGQGNIYKNKKHGGDMQTRYNFSNERGSNVYGHTTLNIPVLVRSPKSSNVGPG